MTRLRADLILLLVALIWGVAFVAQKNAESHIGSFTFVAMRFLLAAIILFPFFLREKSRVPLSLKAGRGEIALLCVSFIGGVLLQQCAISETSIASAGFLTGLYVLFVPLVHWFFYREKISRWIFPAALLSVLGVFLLSGGVHAFDGGFGTGEWLLLGCAVSFGFQVVLMGRTVTRTKAPVQLSLLQYAAVTLAAGVGMFVAEHPTIDDILAAAIPLLYAGILSSALAYTLQAIAQQYAPPSDSALILSGESVFAALAGFILLGESLTGMAIVGCVLIAIAILTVELAPRKKTGL